MPDPAKLGGGSSGTGTSLQPQCLQIRACFKTNSAQSGQVTCVLGLGMLSADGVRTLRSFDAARNNPARIGLIRTASTNQPKPLRPLLLAQIPMVMETPNQNKSISMSFPAHRLAAFYGFAYCRDLPIIPNSRPKHNNGINFRI